jgi:hypothetical protein
MIGRSWEICSHVFFCPHTKGLLLYLFAHGFFGVTKGTLYTCITQPRTGSDDL